MKDLYEVLGVTASSSLYEIKKAYKELALTTHPDKGGKQDRMSLINEAYKTLMDPEKRSQYDEKWKAFSLSFDEEADFLVSGYLATVGVPYSQIFKQQHRLLVQQYRLTPLQKGLARAHTYVEPLQSGIYSNQVGTQGNEVDSIDIFSLIQRKEKEDLDGSFFLHYWSDLTPSVAVELFRDFLRGNYWGEALTELIAAFSQGLEQLRASHITPQDRLLYEGILEIFSLALKGQGIEDRLLLAIQKITEYAKQHAEQSMLMLAPLLQDQYFRHLVSQSFNQYWVADKNKLDEVFNAFDGQSLAKTLIEDLKQKLANDASTAQAEVINQLIQYVHLLYKLEKDLNKHETLNISELATFYREKAYLILDWIPALVGLVSQQIIVNTLMQAGLSFQKAARIGSFSAVQMADEKIALRLYLTAIGIGHYTTPNIDLYANSHSLNFIMHFKYDHAELAEVISALHHRSKVVANLFPFFQPIQSNMAFFMQEDQTLILMRQLLHALIDIVEKNQTSEEEVPLDHEYVTVLYAAYEAYLKNWYDKQHNPEREESFRLQLMRELLNINRWTFACLDANLSSSWLSLKRTEQGWIRPDRALFLPQDKRLNYYNSVEGFEINYYTGDLAFIFKPWREGEPTYNQVLTLLDVQELCKRKLTSAIFSLDPPDPDKPYHPFNQMRFAPSALYESQLLHTMLLTDYLLKFLTVGREVQGCYPYALKPIDDLTGCLPGYLKKIIDDFHGANMGSLHRFWIEAEEIPAAIDYDELKNKDIVRFSFGDIQMVVRKHKMLRDVDGNLNDMEEEMEGWDMYVLSLKEKRALDAGKYEIQGPAMIWLDNTNQVYFVENNDLSCLYTINQYDHNLKRLFKLERNRQGKVITHGYDSYLMCFYIQDPQREELTRRIEHKFPVQRAHIYIITSSDELYYAYVKNGKVEGGQEKIIVKNNSQLNIEEIIEELGEKPAQGRYRLLPPEKVRIITSNTSHTLADDSQAVRVIYRITREVARQTQKPHRFSPEYVFAHEFTLHYNEFAQYFPELGRLRELSKATALIRLIEGERLSNQKKIELLTQKLQDTVFWQNLEAQVEERVRKVVNKYFHDQKRECSTDIIRAKKRESLNAISSKIGTLTLTENSPEIRQVIDRCYEEAKSEIIRKYGYSAWDRESWQFRSRIIDPQIPELIRKLNDEKFNSVFEQLKTLFKQELSSLYYNEITEIITDFMYGRPNALLNVLVAYEELQVQKKIQMDYPEHTLSRISSALNGSRYAIEAIITEQVQAILTKNKEEISKQIARYQRLDKTFAQMGFAKKTKKVDLTDVCLWVPASVQHQVSKGNSRMVYGGVCIAPKIALMQSNNIAGRLLSNQVFRGQPATRVNSGMVSNARPPQVMNRNANAGGMGGNRSNPPPSGGGGGSGSGSSGGGRSGGGGRNVLLNLLKIATPTTNRPNQLEANLPNGTKVLFRRDIGEEAHKISHPNYPKDVRINHYNVEVHAPDQRGKNQRLVNLHIVVNDKLEPIHAFTKPITGELFNVSNSSNKPKSQL